MKSAHGQDISAIPAEPFEPHVPGIDYGVLDRLMGYSLRRAQILIYEDFVRTLAPWHITPQRFSALTIIAHNPRLKQIDLSKIMGIARSGAVMLVDALVELGYVTRMPSPGDRRAWELALTPRGAEDLERINQAVCDHDRRMLEGLTDTEVNQLSSLLKRIARRRDD